MMNADDGNIVTLHIKAETTEEAANAMAERHIPAFPGSVMRVPSGFGFRAETAGRFIQDVMRWFGETSEADCRDGEGFPIGSLLLFSERRDPVPFPSWNSMGMCHCADAGCPCRGECNNRAETIVFRVDMLDESGIPMCNRCADDAMESGIFRTEEPGKV